LKKNIAHLNSATYFRLMHFVVVFVLLFRWTNTNPLVGQELSLDDRLGNEWTTDIQPLMNRYCGDCHMQSGNEGGVNFDDYKDLERIRQHASTWEQIRGVVRAEAMPPPEETKLTPEHKLKLTTWIQAVLHDVDCNCAPPPSPITLRRLNQVEYDNTICDLLGVDFRPSKDLAFVSDDVGNGFDNQGEVLSLPTIVFEKYLLAATHIAKKTIETDVERLRQNRFPGAKLKFSESKSFPLRVSEGTYQLQIRMGFGEKQPDACKVRITLDGKLLSDHDVPGKADTYKHTLELERGEHQLIIEYLDDSDPEKRSDAKRNLEIDSVRLSGPEKGLPAFPSAHEDLVIARPDQKEAPDDNPIGLREAARRVFAKLLPRAYRRSVTDEEVLAVVDVCEKASVEGFSYEESLQFGLQAVLVSPNFLFRNEMIETGKSLDDFGIATRLSYFLWSTMPDDLLFDLARAGKLKDPSVLSQQINRMLESPRSEALVEGFFAQWLGLRNLSKIDIDREKYRGWNDRLRSAMLKETKLFCGHLLQSGSIGDLVNANFTFVNPRMAEFYGMQFEGKEPSEMLRSNPERRRNNDRRDGIYEDEDKWIRVELEKNRKGLLTQASVLALTSNPTRTSPVKRGKWILENVLGDPPPSAPPNVPSLESAEHKQDVSLRERLEIHRSNPSCAGCHKLMDPIGLGLENFDAIGRWRDKDGEILIDSKGELADGRTFQGPSELVELLSTKKQQIVENFVSRMLTYALGRGLQRQDKCDIDRIILHADQNSQSIRSIVEAIVLSNAFLQNPTVSSIESKSHAK